MAAGMTNRLPVSVDAKGGRFRRYWKTLPDVIGTAVGDVEEDAVIAVDLHLIVDRASDVPRGAGPKLVIPLQSGSVLSPEDRPSPRTASK
jgi:hypothetical protein